MTKSLKKRVCKAINRHYEYSSDIELKPALKQLSKLPEPDAVYLDGDGALCLDWDEYDDYTVHSLVYSGLIKILISEGDKMTKRSFYLYEDTSIETLKSILKRYEKNI